MEEKWWEEETIGNDFGDRRLKKRQEKLLEQLGGNPGGSLPSVCRGWSETVGAYRFLNNPKATVKKILSGHWQASAKRAKGFKSVLLIEDTTELDFSWREPIQGAGR